VGIIIIKKFMMISFIICILSQNLLINADSSKLSNNFNESNTALPSNIKVGDILFCDIKPTLIETLKNIRPEWHVTISGFSNDHCAMYVGNNKFIEAAPYRFNFLTKDFIGVVVSPFWKIKLWATNFTYAYVNTTQEIRNNAVSWAKTQIGEPYQIDFRHANPDPSDLSDDEANYWFCSELIWAAYWNQNMKLIVDFGYLQGNASSIIDLKEADQVIWYNNNPPVADAGGPYEGFVNESINFIGYNSIDSDGYIMIYNWSFGDGSYAFGRSTMHIFSEPGIYLVKLTIKDSGGIIKTDATSVTIYKHNEQPTIPNITGVSQGYINQSYNFNIYSNDPDDDLIKYIINWDDNSSNSSIFLLNGEEFNISHQWNKSNLYTIKVYATDGKINSSNTFFEIQILEEKKMRKPHHRRNHHLFN
jgi:uncharacterized protein YycO